MAPHFSTLAWKIPCAPECRRVISPLFLGHNEARVFGFLYFFALITEEGFLISPCYYLELYIQMGIFFLSSFAFSFSSFHSYL